MEEFMQAETGEAEALPVESVAESFDESAAVPAKKQRKPINQQKLQDNLWGWIFCIPLLVGTIWFVYSAFVMALMLSFTNYEMGSAATLGDVLSHLGDYVYTARPLDPLTGLPDYTQEAVANPLGFWYE